MEDSKLLIKNNNRMDCNKDKRIHQLNKLCDETLERNDIFPITVMDAVFDKKTGESLRSIILRNNNIFLEFKGSRAATRIQLPFELRRKGIIISYKDMNNSPITEKLVQDDNISDEAIGLDSSWQYVYFAINKGTTEERPVLEVDSDGFQYYDKDLKKCILWNGETWTNLDGTSL